MSDLIWAKIKSFSLLNGKTIDKNKSIFYKKNQNIYNYNCRFLVCKWLNLKWHYHLGLLGNGMVMGFPDK
jgi:hypothetical protein